MKHVVISDEFADFEITGEVIAGPVSTELDSAGRPRSRWYEATLYRKPGGDGYVLHQVSLSRVWHLDSHADSHVRKPGEAQRRSLPDGAVYCGSLPARRDREQCPPGARLPDPDGTVVTELPQHKVSAYQDAASVVREVMTARRPNGSVSVALSEPMRDLLIEAEKADPAFRGARPVVRM
jgi:hypothetical protein